MTIVFGFDILCRMRSKFVARSEMIIDFGYMSRRFFSSYAENLINLERVS